MIRINNKCIDTSRISWAELCLPEPIEGIELTPYLEVVTDGTHKTLEGDEALLVWGALQKRVTYELTTLASTQPVEVHN